MVYDWFKRTGPAGPDGETPLTEAPQPVASEPPAAPEPSQSDSNQDALEWARQAYARLKAQQEAQKQAEHAEQGEQEPAPSAPTDSVQPVQNSVEGPASPAPAEPPSPPAPPLAPGLSLLEQAAAQRAERQQAITAAASPDSAEPSLGDFDTTFTWSAEVLAAQGKRIDQVSLEEIDWLGRLRRGMEKTRQGFVTQLLDNLGDDPLTPEVVDDLETTLLKADVGVQATDQVLDALRQRLNAEVVDPSEGLRFLKEQLRAILDKPISTSGFPLLAPERGRLNVWLLVGVNGVGKTTTLGKLANLAVRSGYSCLIAAADTFRAAAVQQVQVWGDRSNVPVIANPSANADPAAVVYDAIGAAQSKGTELVLVDTAGRLQTKHNLMEELSKVRRIVDKLAPEAAVESLLVLDASQGQNGLRQAMAFAKAAGLTGVVLTKLDGSARGGVALAVASEAGLPIRFIGAGEGIRDLRPFNSFEFVEALLAR
ncbi:MAG: signal recognition particle-docking protein FtsY [Cyanobium sp.]